MNSARDIIRLLKKWIDRMTSSVVSRASSLACVVRGESREARELERHVC